LWSEHQTRLGDERVDESRPVLDAFQAGPHDRGQLIDAAGGEV
jgi:hypothetical protein